MKAIEKIKEIMKEEGITQLSLSKELKENPQVLNRQLTKNSDLKCGRFVQLLELTGYTVNIQKKEGE